MSSSENASLFEQLIRERIPHELLPMPEDDESVDRAPARRQVLDAVERELALANVLRYFLHRGMSKSRFVLLDTNPGKTLAINCPHRILRNEAHAATHAVHAR